jgi:signal transduction histidine kinase
MKATVNPPDPVSFDLQDRIKKSLDEFTLPKGVIIKKDINLSGSTVIGYERQIGQVFRVVIYNANEALNGEGSLLISAKEVLGKGKIFIKVEISNTNHGLTSLPGPSVFELGHSKRGSKKGFQMGLAWSRLFLQMIGGDINISEDTKLTTVVILIPKKSVNVNETLGSFD